MKKQLLSIAALFAATLISVSAFAQPNEADLPKLADGCEVTIDGVADEAFWAEITGWQNTVFFQQETPTITSNVWKAAWDANGLYVLVDYEDNNWYPSWVSNMNDYESDKVEVYIDVTTTLQDGGGASGGNGNYQLAPNFSEATADRGVELEVTTNSIDIKYGNTFDEAGLATVEYFVAWANIPDENGAAIDPTVRQQIGFDVTIIDNDEGIDTRHRLLWNNDGTIDEPWNNMDDSGLINFTTTEVCASTAISTATVNNNLVYPNVASDVVFVNAEAASYEVINSLGQVVVTSVSNEINVSALNAGVYFVKANDQIARILVK